MLLAHAPAGYLLTRILSRTIYRDAVDPKRSDRLYQIMMAAGVIGSIAPDFDFIYHIFIDSARTPHHSYFTHFPFFWFSAMVLSIVIGRVTGKKTFAIAAVTACAGAILHLVCDTLTGVVYWLAPFNMHGFNVFTVSDVHVWWVTNYIEHWTFLVEIAIIFTAMVIFLRVRETVGHLLEIFRQSAALRAIIIRLAICIAGISMIVLVGSLRFNIDNRILKIVLSLKDRVLSFL